MTLADNLSSFLPFLVREFTVNGVAFVPAAICALLLVSGKLRVRTKVTFAVTVLVVTALYVANFKVEHFIIVLLLILPATAVLTLFFAAVFLMLRVGARKYERFLNGPSNA